MGRKRSSRHTDHSGRTQELKLNTPFDGLAKLRDQLPSSPVPAQEETGQAHETATAVDASPRRAVVRFERKGRGGKAATLVEKLELRADGLQRWARELKTTLGVGGGVEGDTIMLQGDCRERVAALLRKRGIKHISVS